MGGKKKVHPKTRTAAFKASEPSEIVEAPHSFVIHRGLTCPYITDLTLDFRRIMEPFTASNLREKRMNRIKDFVSLSSFFHVSHMGIFNKASTQLSFKVVRLPRGPSLTFKVHQFTLSRDVISLSKKQMIDNDHFKHAPLVIMNNFSGDGKHLKLMATTFQNMFPSINLAQVNIGTIRRCVLFSYNPETKLVEMRHYSVQVVPVGLKRAVQKIVKGTVPNLGKCNEVVDFVTKWLCLRIRGRGRRTVTCGPGANAQKQGQPGGQQEFHQAARDRTAPNLAAHQNRGGPPDRRSSLPRPCGQDGGREGNHAQARGKEAKAEGAT
ncbi:protein Peter pan isoform X2 [Drosophila gunungcola]|uniref:protein Peter pan isoform X2 n=1 Tax=Drosophila gunungcola TaxID=103775 RepID=UPI0022E28A13|nr:protein Peter pan isoform X2 [Drosophila gunungcola]